MSSHAPVAPIVTDACNETHCSHIVLHAQLPQRRVQNCFVCLQQHTMSVNTMQSALLIGQGQVFIMLILLPLSAFPCLSCLFNPKLCPVLLMLLPSIPFPCLSCKIRLLISQSCVLCCSSSSLQNPFPCCLSNKAAHWSKLGLVMLKLPFRVCFPCFSCKTRLLMASFLQIAFTFEFAEQRCSWPFFLQIFSLLGMQKQAAHGMQRATATVGATQTHRQQAREASSPLLQAPLHLLDLQMLARPTASLALLTAAITSRPPTRWPGR